MIAKIRIKHIDLFTAQLMGDSLLLPMYTIDDCSFFCRLFSAEKLDLERLTVDDYLQINREDYAQTYSIFCKTNKIRFANNRDKVLINHYLLNELTKIDKFFSRIGKSVKMDKNSIIARETAASVQKKYNIPPTISFLDMVAKRNGLTYKQAGELPICQALWQILIDEEQQEITKAVGKEFLKNGNK